MSEPEELIGMINRLQDVCAGLYREWPLLEDLPQIAVVGSHNAGKHRILENIVRKKFLPRGSAGVVSRRPLIIQMIKSENEYAEFLHKKHHHFTDFDLVKRELKTEMDKMKRHPNKVSSMPVVLCIHSPHVQNLTLVDFPAVTDVSVRHQEASYESKIHGILMKFISKETCLVLAVSPANTDLTSSSAFKIAKEVDPQGIRTIGVITKLNLMREGMDAKAILENNTLPLRLGFVGVTCCTEKYPDGQKDFRASLMSERKFFLTHPAYRHMADRMGTPYLQKFLSEQLTNHIRESLPLLRNRLQSQLVVIEKEVEKYKIYPDDPSCKTKAMMQMIQDFIQDIEKNLDISTPLTNTDEMSCASKILHIYHDRLPYELYMNELNNLNIRSNICLALMSVTGIRIGVSDYGMECVFKYVTRMQIQTTQNPSMRCCDMVVTELIQLVKQCADKMKRYPKLQKEIERIVKGHISDCEEKVKEQLLLQVNIQSSCINMEHEDFIGFINSDDIQVESKNSSCSQSQQVIKKGWLILQNVRFMSGGPNQIWFVLMIGMLYGFEDKEEKEKKICLPLKNLMVQDLPDFGCKGKCFAIFDPEDRYVFEEYKQLRLLTENEDDLQSWKACLFRAGVDTKEQPDQNSELFNKMDPQLQQHVETIQRSVNSYMKIVSKTQRDLVPKILSFLMVNSIKEFIRTELLAHIYGQRDMMSLMDETAESVVQREELCRMSQTIKEALGVIGSAH